MPSWASAWCCSLSRSSSWPGYPRRPSALTIRTRSQIIEHARCSAEPEGSWRVPTRQGAAGADDRAMSPRGARHRHPPRQEHRRRRSRRTRGRHRSDAHHTRRRAGAGGTAHCSLAGSAVAKPRRRPMSAVTTLRSALARSRRWTIFGRAETRDRARLLLRLGAAQPERELISLLRWTPTPRRHLHRAARPRLRQRADRAVLPARRCSANSEPLAARAVRGGSANNRPLPQSTSGSGVAAPAGTAASARGAEDRTSPRPSVSFTAVRAGDSPEPAECLQAAGSRRGPQALAGSPARRRR